MPLYTQAIANETICEGVRGGVKCFCKHQEGRGASLECIYVGKGKGAYREHAAAVVSLLQAPQRTLQLRVASTPEVHLQPIDGNVAEEEELQ